MAHSKDQVWEKMSETEIRLAKMWYESDGKRPSEIATLLHRDKSTITRHVCKKMEKKKQGRPPALTQEQIDRIEAKV